MMMLSNMVIINDTSIDSCADCGCPAPSSFDTLVLKVIGMQVTVKFCQTKTREDE